MAAMGRLEHIPIPQSPLAAAKSRDSASIRFSFQGLITEGMRSVTLDDAETLSNLANGQKMMRATYDDAAESQNSRAAPSGAWPIAMTPMTPMNDEKESMLQTI